MLRSHHVRQRVDASAADVFEWVADADAQSRWSGVPARVVAGPRRTDVGTVRRVEVLGAVEIDEEVIVCERPRRLVYRIVRGLPLRHHYAEVLIEPESEDRCWVTWSQRFESRVPGVARLMNRLAEATVRRGTPGLKALAALPEMPNRQTRQSAAGS